ncbi:hypothetical protein [Micromonospora rosaria]|uniref:hypothetical protein n=1 Tax=Micromonospora rosaria TaxID=47874 RepID=UPI001FE05B3E|nr:hypothetical protein [Micromonospora rosaria]
MTPPSGRGRHGDRARVITDDMLHTVLCRRANGETVEQIRPDLIIPTGKRKGCNPSVASIYRALAAHEKAQAYPDAVEQAHAEYAPQNDGTGTGATRARQEGDSADAQRARRPAQLPPDSRPGPPRGE